MHKTKMHFLETKDEWHDLRLGKFTSSTIYQLFEDSSKQTKANAAMTQIQNGHWVLNENIVSARPNTAEINYAAKYLLSSALASKNDLRYSKCELKAAFKDESFSFQNIENFNLRNSTALLMIACYAIEYIECMAGSAVSLAKKKAHELIYQEAEEDLSNVAVIEWGIENEPLAARQFELENLDLFLDQRKVSFIEIEGLESGSTPDDTLDNYTIPVEYKCPKNKGIHYDHCFLNNALDLYNFDKQKYYQVQHQIWTMGATHGYWSSFDKRLLRVDNFKNRALHTLKIKLNPQVAREFPKRIEDATRVRDEFINNFLKYN